jgi:hypothetical protein
LRTSLVHSKDHPNRKTRFLVTSFLGMTLIVRFESLWQVWKPALPPKSDS